MLRPALFALALSCCVMRQTTTMRQLPEPGVMRAASIQGKYEELLLTFEAPEDAHQYGETYDYGWWNGHEYKGVAVPPGYWVYLYPIWYVWERTAPPPAPSSDPRQ